MKTPCFNHKDLIDILVRDCPAFDGMDLSAIIYSIERRYTKKIKKFGPSEYDPALLF